MKRIAMTVLIGLLAGCQSGMDGVLSNETLERDGDHRICAAEGYHPGTENHGFCILELRIWRYHMRSLSRDELLNSPPPAREIRPR